MLNVKMELITQGDEFMLDQIFKFLDYKSSIKLSLTNVEFYNLYKRVNIELKRWYDTKILKSDLFKGFGYIIIDDVYHSFRKVRTFKYNGIVKRWHTIVGEKNDGPFYIEDDCSVKVGKYKNGKLHGWMNETGDIWSINTLYDKGEKKEEIIDHKEFIKIESIYKDGIKINTKRERAYQDKPNISQTFVKKMRTMINVRTDEDIIKRFTRDD